MWPFAWTWALGCWGCWQGLLLPNPVNPFPYRVLPASVAGNLWVNIWKMRVKSGPWTYCQACWQLLYQRLALHPKTWRCQLWSWTFQSLLIIPLWTRCWEMQRESDWRNNKHKTHTQAKQGSMTEQCDPHKISVKDTNKILTVTVCMQFIQCKGFILPPCGLFIVVRSYSQLILRLESLRNALPKMYNFYARFYWI